MDVIKGLRGILPANCVLSAPEDTRPFECDGLTLIRQIPMVVVLPENLQQLQRVLRFCNANQVPIVPRGAGTGLAGSALPHPAGRAAVDGEVQSHPGGGRACAHGHRRAGRAQSRHLRSRCAPWPVLRAGSLQPDCLHDWRQRGREFRRRALPEIRADAAQRAGRARTDDGRRGIAAGQPRHWMRQAWTCWRWPSVPKACWP